MVRKDTEGFFYRDGWAAFTALVDARNPRARKAAAKLLAQLDDPLQTAPELGFDHPPAWALMLPRDGRPARSDGDDTADGTGQVNESVWLTYWKHLSPAHRERVSAHPQLGQPGCLELALSFQAWGVADALWDAGHRFDAEARARATALWVFACPHAGVGAYERFRKHFSDPGNRQRSMTRFREEWLLHPGAQGSPETFESTASDLALQERAFVLLCQRWLRRAGEAQVDFGATRPVYRVIADKDPEWVGASTALMHFIRYRPILILNPELLQTIWIGETIRAGYDWTTSFSPVDGEKWQGWAHFAQEHGIGPAPWAALVAAEAAAKLEAQMPRLERTAKPRM